MDEAGETRSTIADLEERRYRAMLQADLDALAALLAEEVVYTHSNAERDTKRSYLEKISAGHLRYLHISRPEETIVVAGTTAIVVGRMVADLIVGGAQRHLDNRCIAVWACQDGRWRLLAFQGTVIPIE